MSRPSPVFTFWFPLLSASSHFRASSFGFPLRPPVSSAVKGIRLLEGAMNQRRCRGPACPVVPGALRGQKNSQAFGVPPLGGSNSPNGIRRSGFRGPFGVLRSHGVEPAAPEDSQTRLKAELPTAELRTRGQGAGMILASRRLRMDASWPDISSAITTYSPGSAGTG